MSNEVILGPLVQVLKLWEPIRKDRRPKSMIGQSGKSKELVNSGNLLKWKVVKKGKNFALPLRQSEIWQNVSLCL